MSWLAFSVREPAVADFRGATHTAIFVFIGYLVGAEIAFFIGTLSDKIFAPFWPPNIVLLAAILLMPLERSWICIAAAFPAHVIAEAGVGMPVPQMLVAFASNVVVAFAGAAVMGRFLERPPWFSTVRKATDYIVLVGIICPAIGAVIGAFVPVLGGVSEDYATLWLQWLAANALGNLTLGPIAVIIVGRGLKSFWPSDRIRQIEAVLLIVALAVVTALVFRQGAGRLVDAFLPSMLYAPLPLIIWYAARFGAAGASIGIVTVTAASVGSALNGPSLFVGGTPEVNVFALQVFLICLAVPILLLGASIDQTRQVEGELGEDQERIALVAGEVDLGFWHRSSATQRFWVSLSSRHLFDFSEAGEITESTILAVVHPADVGIVRDALHQTKPGGGDSAVEFRVVLHGGETRWILCRSRSKSRKDDRSFETSGMFVDITARKTAEVEAEKQRRELAHLMRVSQAGELSGGLAHEITQPLTAILANAQAARLMLDSSPVDLPGIAEVLDDIIHEDYRAGEIIHRLRSLLKDSDNSSEEVDLNDLVNSTFRLLRTELISRGVKIDRDLDPAMPTVFGDPVQLQQVLLNLVMNATESVHQMATLRRTILLRTLKCNDKTLEVCVVDQGTGISPENHPRIFEPFFTTKERGLGLGLSICSAIVARHRGTLTLENNLHGGVTASMRIPVERRNGSSA